MIGWRQDFFGGDFEETLTAEMHVLSRTGEKYEKICRNDFLACFYLSSKSLDRWLHKAYHFGWQKEKMTVKGLCFREYEL